MKSRIPTLKPRIPTMQHRTVPLPPKQADAVYTTPEHRAWSAKVIHRAGGRCEWVEDGMRCHKARPEHRVVADHKIEVKDGGDPLDPRNGQCLCVQHNTQKGIQARTARMAAPTSPNPDDGGG